MTALSRALRTGPNVVTLSRLGLVAASASAYFAGAVGTALALGAAAGVTDYVDGWWARRTGQVTRIGEILDQFCDIALEVVFLVIAVSLKALPAAVLIPHVLREVWVTSLRRYSIELGQNIPSRKSGKLKAAFVGWSFVPLLLGAMEQAGSASAILLRIGQVGIGLGIALTVASGIAYTRDFIAAYEGAHRERVAGGGAIAAPFR